MDFIWFFLVLAIGAGICWPFWWRPKIHETRLLRTVALHLGDILRTRNNKSKREQKNRVEVVGGGLHPLIQMTVGGIVLSILTWARDALTSQFGSSTLYVVIIAVWSVLFAVANDRGRQALLWLGPIIACAAAGFRLIPAAAFDSLKQLQATSDHLSVKLVLQTVLSIPRSVPLLQVSAAGAILFLVDVFVELSRDEASSALRDVHHLLPASLGRERRGTPIESVAMYSAWISIYVLVAVSYFSSQRFVSQTDKVVTVYFFGVILTTLSCWMPMVLIDGQNNAYIHRRQFKAWLVLSLIVWTLPPGAWFAKWIASLV